MKEFVVTAAVLVLAAVLLASTAAAVVEVTAKRDTKLYDSSGKVIREVGAGSSFQADKASGDWVYGFLRTSGGGARGWIPIAALDLDDEAKRELAHAGDAAQEKVAQPENAVRQDEPILLRYKIAEGELQVYQTTASAVVTFSMQADPRPQAASVAVIKTQIRIGNFLRGKGQDNEGTILAEAGLHRLEMTIGMLEEGGWVEKRFDHQGMRAYKDGRLVSSTRYGEGELADAPGVAPFLNKPFPCRLTGRRELLEMEVTAESQKLLASFGGGASSVKDLLMGELVYPRAPVQRGSSWEEDVSQDVPNSENPRAPSQLSGRAKYTVLGRVAYGNRQCVRIRMEATLAGAVQSSPARATSQGDFLIDEATGIPLATTVKAAIVVSLNTEEGTLTVSAVNTTETSYVGNKFND
jgi:hypothetical protein